MQNSKSAGKDSEQRTHASYRKKNKTKWRCWSHAVKKCTWGSTPDNKWHEVYQIYFFFEGVKADVCWREVVKTKVVSWFSELIVFEVDWVWKKNEMKVIWGFIRPEEQTGIFETFVTFNKSQAKELDSLKCARNLLILYIIFFQQWCLMRYIDLWKTKLHFYVVKNFF